MSGLSYALRRLYAANPYCTLGSSWSVISPASTISTRVRLPRIKSYEIIFRLHSLARVSSFMSMLYSSGSGSSLAQY